MRAARCRRHHLRIAANVTADAAGLRLQAGNATILRGGSGGDAQQSPSPRASTRSAPAGCLRMRWVVIATTDRAAVGCLIKDDKHVDVIARGGKGSSSAFRARPRCP